MLSTLVGVGATNDSPVSEPAPFVVLDRGAQDTELPVDAPELASSI